MSILDIKQMNIDQIVTEIGGRAHKLLLDKNLGHHGYAYALVNLGNLTIEGSPARSLYVDFFVSGPVDCYTRVYSSQPSWLSFKEKHLEIETARGALTELRRHLLLEIIADV